MKLVVFQIPYGVWPDISLYPEGMRWKSAAVPQL